VATYIKKELQSHDLIKDPVVTVEYMNLSIAVNFSQNGKVNVPFGIYRITGHTTIRTGRALHADLWRNNYIKKELQSHDLIKDPVVTVEYMNLSIAVMGEVNNPAGRALHADLWRNNRQVKQVGQAQILAVD